MLDNVTIRRLTAPTARELDQLASVVFEALRHDSVARAGCSDDERLMYMMHRSIAAGAAVGAHLFAAFHNHTEEVIGAVAFYGPGVEICGDELQRSQGFDDFLQNLHEAGMQWWNNFLPEYAAVTDAVIGQGVKKGSWKMNSLAVAAPYRGRGVGRALVEAGEALARQDKLPVIFEAEGRHNTDIYQHFGYRVLEKKELKGGNGVPDFVLTIVRKDFL